MQIKDLRFMALAALTVVTACGGSDDSTGELSVLPADEISGKYVVTDASSTYKTIELTSAGKYVMLQDTAKAKTASKSAVSLETLKNQILRGRVCEMTRAAKDTIIAYGSYTKVDEDTLKLGSLAKLAVNSNLAGVVNSFSLVFSADSIISLPVSRQSDVIADGQNTEKLCRTWNIVTLRMEQYLNDRKMSDVTYRGGEIYTSSESGQTVYVEIPTQTFFSQSGTYALHYTQSGTELSEWNWENESEGTLLFTGESAYQDMVKETVTFSGNTAVIKEEMIWTVDGMIVRLVGYTNLKEAVN